MSTDIRDLETLWRDEPDNFETFSALEQLYVENNDWRGLSALFDEGADRFGDQPDYGARLVGQLREMQSNIEEGQELGEFLVALGDACIDHLGNRDEAMRAYQTSFKVYPDDTTCLDRARDIYRKLGDFDRTLVLYKLELKVKKGGEDYANTLVKMAQIQGDDLREFDAAIETLMKAIEIDEEHETAARLFNLYDSGNTLYGVIHELLLDARERGGREAADLYVKAARLEREREAGSAENALAFTREALECVMDHEEALLLKASLHEELGLPVSSISPETLEEAGVESEASIVEEDEKEELETDEQDEVEQHEDEVEDQQAELEQVDLEQEELEQEEDQQDELEQEEDQQDDQNEDEEQQNEDEVEQDEDEVEQDELEQEEDQQDELEQEEDQQDDQNEDEEQQNEDEVEQDELEENAGEVELPEGVSGLVARLNEDPTDADALLALGEACREEGSYDLMIEQFESSIKRLRKKEGELEAMLMLANTFWRDLDNLEKAEYYFKRIKLLDTEHPDMIAFYEDFFERSEQWKKLFNHINNAALSTQDVDRKRELTRRLANIALERMDDPGRAIDAWKSFLRQIDADNDQVAHQELRRLYKENSRWSQLVDLYKDELAALADDQTTEKLATLRTMAKLYDEQLQLEPMVINTLQLVLELDPNDPDAFERLRELMESGSRHNDLAKLLTNRAEAAVEEGDLATATELFKEVARIWEEDLRNVTQALPYLERVIELDPEDQETIDLLKDIYKSRRDFGSLFDIMRREAAALTGEERLEKLREILSLAGERVRDPELVAPILEDILELAPEDLEALDQLEQLRRRSSAPGQLVDTLLRKAEVVDQSDALTLINEAAELRFHELDDQAGAEDLWALILESDADHEAAFNSLSQAYLSTRRFDELEELYRDRNAFDQLFDLMDSAAATIDDKAVRTMLFARMARLAEEDLEDADRVIISLESLLAISDHPAVVARSLVDWYKDAGELSKQIEMFRIILEHASEPESEKKALENLRRLELERDNASAALEWAVLVVENDPEDGEALALSLEIARTAEAMRSWADAVDDIATDVDEPTTQDALWLSVGTTYAEEIEDIARAIEIFERLRERHPNDLEFLGILEALYHLAGDGHRRIAILRDQIDILTDRGATKADLVDELSKIADVQRTELDEADAARDTYAEILDIDPEHLPSLRGIRKLYREEERWDDVIECLVREESLVATAAPEDRYEVWLSLGDAYRIHKDELAESLRYYGMILAENPDHEAAVEAMEELLTEPDFARDAALLLEPIFRDSGRVEQLIRALEARRVATDDRFEEAEILDELIPLYQGLEETETAFERACRQFELDPERSDIWLRLEQLGAGLNRWAELEEIFSRFAPADASASATSFDLLRHLAAIREYQLDMPEAALEAWETLYEYDPLDTAHVDALERLYTKTGNHDQLVNILVAKSDLSQEPDERIELLREAARIADDVLADTERTVDTLQRLLQIEENDEWAVAQLKRLLRAQERWFDLSMLLEDQANLSAEFEKRRDLLLELAAIKLEQTDDAPGAVDTIRLVFSENPTDEVALRAIETTDEALAERDDSDQLRLELANLVEPTYRHDGNTEKLIHVLNIKLRAADEYEKTSILDELADLYVSSADDIEKAFEATRRAVLLSPEDADRRLRLERFAERAEKMPEAIQTLVEAAEASAGQNNQIFRRVGHLFDERMGNPDAAIEAYERAIEVDAFDTESMRALEELYESTERYEELANNLRTQLSNADDERRLQLLRRIGALEEDILDRPDEAIDAYYQITLDEPDNADAMLALERLYQRTQRWTDLGEVLNRRAESTLDPEEKLELLDRLAAVREDKLDDTLGAAEVFRRQLEVEPTYEPALEELERIYESNDDFTELALVLRVRRDNAAARVDVSELNRIELRLAGILARELYEPGEALELYRAVLSRDPANPDAIAALEELSNDENMLEEIARDLLVPYYRSSERWEDLVDLLDRRQVLAHDPEERARILTQIGRTQAEELDNLESAFDSLGEAWKLDVENDDLRDLVVRLAAENESWERLAEILKDVLPEIRDPDTLLHFNLQLAGLYRDYLENISEAEIYYREAIHIDEESADAFRALEEILQAQERWHDLVELLERRFNTEVARGDAEAVVLLHRIGTIQDQMLEDGFTAVETYARILQFDPADQQTVSALDRLYRDQERWEDLSILLNDQISLASEPEDIIEYKQKLAAVRAGQLHDYMGAIDIHRDILTVEPDHEISIASLELLIDEVPEEFVPDVARLLTPVYRHHEQWPRLIDTLQKLAAALQNPSEEIPVLREVAQIVEDQLNDPDQAAEIYRRLFELDPNDPETRRALERLAARRRAWSELAATYGAVLETNFEMSDETRADVLVGHAQIHEERLENLEDAREVYQEVLLLRPEHEGALDALERVYSRLEAWDDLGELYRRRADQATDPREARDWRESMASIYEDVLEDQASAIDVYNEILANDPEDITARRALERLFAQSRRWYDLADLYRQQSELSKDPGEREEFRFKLAQILESELDQIDEALELYRDILASDPTHYESRRALEGLARDLAIREDSWPEHRLQILDLLIESYDPRSERERVTGLLEQKVELVETIPDKVAVYLRLAEVLLQSIRNEERSQALSYLAIAYRLDPLTSEDVKHQIADLADELHAWERLIPSYLTGIEATNDPENQVRLLESLAEVFTVHLNDRDSGISVFQQIIEINPTHETALSRLETLYGELELWAPLVEILQKRAENVYDPNEQRKALERIATIQVDVLAQITHGISTYKQLREIEPSRIDYIEMLEELLEESGRYEELAEVLQDKLSVIEDVAGRKEALLKLAMLHDEFLESPDRAIDAYRGVLELDPEHEASIHALVRLFEQVSQWPELLDALQMQFEFAEDVDTINSIDLNLGRVLAQHLNSPFEAMEKYKTVLTRSPASEEARTAMASLLERDDTREEAVEILEELFRSTEEWRELDKLYELQLEHVRDPERRVSLYTALASLQANELDTPQLSFMTFGRGLREMPASKKLVKNIEALVDKLQNYDELIAVYEDALENAEGDPNAELNLRKRLGARYLEFEEYDEAIGHLERAFEIDEYDGGVLDHLDKLYQLTNRWDDLQRVLEQELVIADPSRVNDVRYRLGYLHEQIFEDTEDALDQYRQIVADEPGHGGAIEGLERLMENVEIRRDVCQLLEPIYQQHQAWERLTKLYNLKLDVADGTTEEADLLERIARIEIDEFDRLAVGYAYLGRSLRAEPLNNEVQVRLEEIADQTGMHEEMVALYEEIIEDLTDPVRVVELASVAGRVSIAELENLDQAASLYDRVLELEPENEEALDALEVIARERGDSQRLARVLERKAEVIFDPDARRDTLIELGRVRNEREEFEAAVEAYQQALAIDEANVEIMESLVGLLEITERYDELVEVLERLVSFVNDGEKQFVLLVRIGQYARVLLKDPERAIDAYRRAMDRAPDDPDVLQSLDELYTHVENWNELREIIRRRLELVDDEEERLTLLVRGATISYEKFGEVAQAINDYQRAMEISPTHPRVIDALDGLYKSEERWDDLYAMYESMAENATEPEQICDLRVRMANISAEHFENRELAIQQLTMVLDAMPEHVGALSVLADLYESAGDHTSLLEVLQRQLDAAQTEEEKIAALLRRARLHRDQLDAAGAAATDLVAIIEIQPLHEHALPELKALYETLGAYEQFYGILDYEASYRDDEEEKVQIYRDMAKIARDEIDDPARRIKALEKAYEIAPSNLNIVQPLLDALIAGGQTERAEPILNEIINSLKGERRMKEVIQFLHLQGKLAEQRGDLDAAFEAYTETHKVDASYIPNLISLGKLLYAREDWDEALKIFQTLLLHQMNIESDAEKVDVYYHLGMIRWQQGDSRRAKDMFNRALNILPGHGPSKEAISQL